MIGKVLFLKNFSHLKRINEGGVLIEFTFCIPVAIMLLFFVNDHYRLYELRNKVKSSICLTASMIQQIGNTTENKQLTGKDIKVISYASCLNFFHTNSMFFPYIFDIYCMTRYYYVKRISYSKYNYQYCYCHTNGKPSSTLLDGMSLSVGSVTQKTKSQIKAIEPRLLCNEDGDEKLLIRRMYKKGGNSLDKSKLGFFVLSPKLNEPSATANDDVCSRQNHTAQKLIIRPKPGLFPIKKVT